MKELIDNLMRAMTDLAINERLDQQLSLPVKTLDWTSSGVTFLEPQAFSTQVRACNLADSGPRIAGSGEVSDKVSSASLQDPLRGTFCQKKLGGSHGVWLVLLFVVCVFVGVGLLGNRGVGLIAQAVSCFFILSLSLSLSLARGTCVPIYIYTHMVRPQKITPTLVLLLLSRFEGWSAICMYRHLCMSVCMHACMHACMHECVCVCVGVRPCLSLSLYIYSIPVSLGMYMDGS